MTNEEWIAEGRPHWRCRICKGIMVTIPQDDDFVCPLHKDGLYFRSTPHDPTIACDRTGCVLLRDHVVPNEHRCAHGLPMGRTSEMTGMPSMQIDKCGCCDNLFSHRGDRVRCWDCGLLPYCICSQGRAAECLVHNPPKCMTCSSMLLESGWCPLCSPEWIAQQSTMRKIALPFIIMGDNNEKLVKINPDGNVELWGDVNEAALRFWNAVCQLSNGTLTHIQ